VQTVDQQILRAIIQTSIWEWFAVATAIFYVILAAKRLILCWLFALISSALYVYICFISKLYIETFLQVFYFGMGVLGWILWNKSSAENNEIKTWGIRLNLINILLSGILTFGLGYYFKLNTNQASPFLDAFVTSFALSATLMITKKVHEGWAYFIAVDIVSIYLYASRDLYLSSFLSIVYTILAIFGWLAWLKAMKKERSML
jgi:nicotinamide mononucleotide transporter